ncbi:MurR/RpiR family transcriptional regulator [Saccharopolyspora phatthalungensis]|uniref:DNA-binding MurR/RpiR family transcriptional regulator n=1 Tax=Saccharopolyspora phatthalungensis TaxID=664693 RepID=A0A840QG92_9PSEU|nr:MurR/RpiR family transcriptional regulator [Saccharopolyspora phatthalungensis]MBB5159864.1 DNA-binding MurR/RpiR family transcriptional regulator [Saccharopolyspora phatthalungensis]
MSVPSKRLPTTVASGRPGNTVSTDAAEERGAASLAQLFAGHALTPSQRRIAAFLSSRPVDEAARISITQVAAGAGVSQPSVSRFAVALGYRGFNELRVAIQAVEPTTADAATPSTPSDSPAQHRIQREIDALRRLQENVADGAGIASAAAVLAASRPLPIVGLRVSAPLATMLGQFASKIMPDVRIYTHGGSALTEALTRAKLDGATALLAIGMPRYPRELRDALDLTSSLGLETILITDSRYSSIADLADHLLLVEPSHDFTFDSYAAPSVMCGLLLQALVESQPKDNSGRLDDFDELASAHEFFVE